MNVPSPILAPCRTCRRAAFRRVAGVALPESGRGMEEINHGRTPAYAKATAGRRTGLTNVRVLLDKGERRCACGEAVRLPDERSEELCEAKSQEAARRASVLVCGSKQVGVGAGAGQFENENVLVYLVDEKPVGCDMAFAVVRPVAGERMVVVGRRKLFSIAQLIDNRLKLLNRKMALQHQLVVALECRCVADGILHFAKSSHILSRFVYVGQFGSCAMRSPSSIAAMVSAFGNGSAEMVKGMRFSRTTVLMYTVITDDAERPMLLQKSTKRFLVGASSEKVMLAMVFLHSFESKTRVSYTKLTGLVKEAA